MNFSSEKSKKNIFQCLRSLFNMRKIIFCIERSLSVQISNHSTTLISTEVVIFCQYIKLQWGFFQLCELIFLTFSIYHNEICSLVKSNFIVTCINVKGYMIFDYMTNLIFVVISIQIDTCFYKKWLNSVKIIIIKWHIEIKVCFFKWTISIWIIFVLYHFISWTSLVLIK